MEQLVSNQSQLGHRKCLVLIIGWSLSKSFYLAPSIEEVVVHLIIVLPGCLTSCLVCLRRAGCRHLHVLHWVPSAGCFYLIGLGLGC
jgi:hypothetical protein